VFRLVVETSQIIVSLRTHAEHHSSGSVLSPTHSLSWYVTKTPQLKFCLLLACVISKSLSTSC